VMKLGDQAKKLTLNWLETEAMEVHTRREKVMKSDRLFAMVRFPAAKDPSDQWLSSRLVKAGYARIYGKGTALSDGTSEREYIHSLKELESNAKRARRGAWK